MKKIIKGRLYDTTTAKELGWWENIQDVRNFSHFSETLYRKRTGEFFLYGKGGPSTKYSQRVDQNCWSGGEDIFPVSAENARSWAEEHLDADDYEKIFGPVSEDEEDILITFKASAAQDRKLADVAAERGTSKSELLRSMIDSL